MQKSNVTLRVETWTIKGRRVGKVAARYPNGTFHGATNFPTISRVGQVATHRRVR